MPAEFRRKVRIIATLLFLGGGFLVAQTIDDGMVQQPSTPGPYPVLDAPTFVVRLTRGQLELTGTTASAEHEIQLRQVIADQFGDSETQTRFVPAIAVPDNWVPASIRLLNALAAMESASAVMRNHTITVRGITADASTLAARLDFLRSSMPAEASIDQDIIVVNGSAALDTMCQRTFAELIKGPVHFRQSSAEIRTSSYSNLDKIIDFAYDCSHMAIAITGHSDASGDASWNKHLSRARAQAVADYLMRGGVAAERLLVAGKGSSTPIADNDTAHGRSLNRRIEFELQQPSL